MNVMLVLVGERLELRTPRRGAVLVQDLADHAGGKQIGEPREVDRRFRVADALQHAAFSRAQRKHVSAVTQIRRNRRGIDGDANRRRAILRADARRHAKARRRVDAHGVRGAIVVEIRLGHRREAERVDAIAGERQTDHAAGLLDHEVDHLGRHELRRADEIPFVLAILVVRDNDELARRGCRRSPVLSFRRP